MLNSPAETDSYSPADIDSATEHALIALLWTEQDLDANYGTEDVAQSARDSLREEIAGFVESIDDEYTGAFDGVSAEQLGHDFILTRNGHGAGFWDRGRGDAGRLLTDLCKPYGDLSAYVASGVILTQ